MSTAYFVVIDSDEPGFDEFVDGKYLTRHLSAVNKVAKSCGLRPLEEFAFQDLSEFGGPEFDVEWFDGSEGVNWVSTVLEQILDNPGSVKDANEVIADLKEYQRVFTEVDTRQLKWHLELDF